MRGGHPRIFHEIPLSVCRVLFKGHEEFVEEEGNVGYMIIDHLKLQCISSIKCHFSSSCLLDGKEVEIKKRPEVTLWIKERPSQTRDEDFPPAFFKIQTFKKMNF